MKIGTKANAIDDLGKFDGSKMTIKVDGKQIYPQKRYAIVRVDNMCPAITEEGINICKTDKNCRNKCPYKYGDTKEQLIRKVAQVMLRKFIANYLMNGVKPKLADEQIQIVYKNYLEIAKEIVEFLGVEE